MIESKYPYMVIAVSGKAQSGKDTLCETIEEVFAKDFDIFKFAFADELKEISKQVFGLTDHQVRTQEGKREYLDIDMTPRNVLQQVGEAMKKIDPYCWTKIIQRRIKQVFKDHILNNCEEKPIVILLSDLRFISELEFLESFIPSENLYTIRLIRTERMMTGKAAKHESEINLDNYKGWHHILFNKGGLEELKLTATGLIENQIKDNHFNKVGKNAR